MIAHRRAAQRQRSGLGEFADMLPWLSGSENQGSPRWFQGFLPVIEHKIRGPVVKEIRTRYSSPGPDANSQPSLILELPSLVPGLPSLALCANECQSHLLTVWVFAP